jgi:hypothetical protein
LEKGVSEESLGRSIRDYLTGELVEETTYEDFRQALAKMLVEEKGFPVADLKPKVGITFPIEAENYCRVADIVVQHDGRPALLVFFTAGQPGTFSREIAAAARLIEGGPAPLALATDTRDAVLIETAAGAQIGRGMEAVPDRRRLRELLSEHPAPELDEERLEKERRILYTYSEYLNSGCSGSVSPHGRR